MDARDWAYTFLFPLTVATVVRTWTTEEIFRDVQELWKKNHQKYKQLCEKDGKTLSNWCLAKLFYGLSCDWCSSFYVTAIGLWITGFRLLEEGVVGFLGALLVSVFLANTYISLYSLLRVDLRKQRAEADRVDWPAPDGNGKPHAAAAKSGV